jgi:hypothetical protein
VLVIEAPGSFMNVPPPLTLMDVHGSGNDSKVCNIDRSQTGVNSPTVLPSPWIVAPASFMTVTGVLFPKCSDSRSRETAVSVIVSGDSLDRATRHIRNRPAGVEYNSVFARYHTSVSDVDPVSRNQDTLCKSTCRWRRRRLWIPPFRAA